MKKKIKDLTEDEINGFCNDNYYCHTCQLYISEDCMYCKRHDLDTYGEEEVEIDE
ncbi:MAG TPA: hypothetical protein PKV66_00800 [Candidatus Pelethenecus sp.]|nr:hypothetical protein [Candidatus Pelethenecus sp.]